MTELADLAVTPAKAGVHDRIEFRIEREPGVHGCRIESGMTELGDLAVTPAKAGVHGRIESRIKRGPGCMDAGSSPA
jgi:hypothetical protein